jgi:CheY-like chemotaxis protein
MSRKDNQTTSHELKVRALVVDDEPDVAGTIRGVLEHEGFEVETAQNGRDALDLLVSGPQFDVVITDVRMPEMDGLELLRQVRKLRKNLPVIVLTGYASEKDGLEALDEGAFDYISKPFKVKALMEVVRGALKK